MNNLIKMRLFLFYLFILTGSMQGQKHYNSVGEIKEEWGNYSKFQRDEIVSFCNFLFEEKHYDRALLNLFQFLYRFPGDTLEPTIYYLIGKCYEFTHNPDLAIVYYQRILDDPHASEKTRKAANYSKLYLQLINNENKIVLEQTYLTEDPYLLVMRGYAQLQEFDWASARLTFLSTQERFGHEYYSKLIHPIFHRIDNVENVPKRNIKMSLLASIFPGGGQGYLGKWNSGIGVLSSLIILTGYLHLSSKDNQDNLTFREHVTSYNPHYISSKSVMTPNQIQTTSSNVMIHIPSIVLWSGIYIGSCFEAVENISSSNQDILNEYLQSILEECSIIAFLDFEEPKLVNE